MATAALFENAYERKDIYRWNGTERDARSLTCSSHAFSQKKPEDYPSPHASLSYLPRDFLWICVLFFYLFIGNMENFLVSNLRAKWARFYQHGKLFYKFKDLQCCLVFPVINCISIIIFLLRIKYPYLTLH